MSTGESHQASTRGGDTATEEAAGDRGRSNTNAPAKRTANARHYSNAGRVSVRPGAYGDNETMDQRASNLVKAREAKKRKREELAEKEQQIMEELALQEQMLAEEEAVDNYDDDEESYNEGGIKSQRLMNEVLRKPRRKRARGLDGHALPNENGILHSVYSGIGNMAKSTAAIMGASLLASAVVGVSHTAKQMLPALIGAIPTQNTNKQIGTTSKTPVLQDNYPDLFNSPTLNGPATKW